MGRVSTTTYKNNARNFTPVYNPVIEHMYNSDVAVCDSFIYTVNVYTTTANTEVFAGKVYPRPDGYLLWDSSIILKNYIGATLYDNYTTNIFNPSSASCNVMNYRTLFEYDYVDGTSSGTENIIQFDKLVWNGVVPNEYFPYLTTYMTRFEPSTSTPCLWLGSQLLTKYIDSDDVEFNSIFTSNIFSNIFVPYSAPIISDIKALKVNVYNNDGTTGLFYVTNNLYENGGAKLPTENLIMHLGVGPVNLNERTNLPEANLFFERRNDSRSYQISSLKK